MKPGWAETCTLCEWDFLSAVLEFRNLSIQDALNSEDYIIKILAILDKRVGKRTLQKIKEAGEYMQYPQWARQFYELRLEIASL
jgi:N12 class adenine-specific DNA methylase